MGWLVARVWCWVLSICGCLIMSRRRFARGIVKPAVGSRLTYPVANLIAYFISHNPGISAEFTKRRSAKCRPWWPDYLAQAKELEGVTGGAGRHKYTPTMPRSVTRRKAGNPRSGRHLTVKVRRFYILDYLENGKF